MRVSVLVAVYNMEHYLPVCLDSLLRQTYNDIEILCVDDASVDSSWHILNDYAERDARIKIWKHASNQGQAKARNLALSYSTGDIVMFLDSDDWLGDDAIESVVECFKENEDTDCVLLDLRYVYPDGKEQTYRTPAFEAMDGKTAFVKSLTWDIHGVYAVRGDIHRKFPYDDTCRHYSDDNTTRLHYYSSKKVRCCSGKYYYRQMANSVSHAVDMSQLDYLKANESMKRQLVNLCCDDDVITLYENERWKNLIGVNLFFVYHNKEFCHSDLCTVRNEIRRVWEGIEYNRLYAKNKYKPGYYPFPHAWPLFKIEQAIFCWFRILLKRGVR